MVNQTAKLARKKRKQPSKNKNVTYKVWICIEEYDHKTNHGTELDAPGASIEVFGTYDEAWGYAERLTALAKEHHP